MSIYIPSETLTVSETVAADIYASPAPSESTGEVVNAKSDSEEDGWQTAQVEEFAVVTNAANDRGEVTGEIRRNPSE